MKALVAALALALGLGVALPDPAPAADIFFKGRFGDVEVGVNTGGRFGRHGRHGRPFRDRRHRDHIVERRLNPAASPGPLRGGVVNDFARDQARAAAEAPRSRHRPHRRYRNQPFLADTLYFDGGYRSETREQPAPAPAAAPPPPMPEIVEIDPPDARGPSFETARGRFDGVPSYSVGAALPRGRPHVALDWRDYNLPRPPRGQSYVRFDGAILLIDPTSRVVRRIVWPVEG